MSRVKFNEETLSEKPAIEQLQRMGYDYVPGEALDPQENEDSERTSRREVVLVGRLKRKLAELNPGATEETIDKAIRQYITNIPGTGLLDENKNFHKNVVSYVSVEQDVSGMRRNLTIRFIDFHEPENNEFLVVNQFWVKGPKVHAKPDLVVFINGIPVVVIECKSPVAKDTGVADALSQLVRYQREIPALFRTNQFLMGVNLFGAKYGVVGAGPEDFHKWKAESEENIPVMLQHPSVKEMMALNLIKKEDLTPSPAAQDVLIAALLNKRNLLDIIQNFIVYDAEEGKVKKKICRYQQFTAVQKIARRVLHEPEKKGIVWHWQGSGKSLTMIFSTLKLKREEARLKNPYILIVTDRKDLDRQIEGKFRDCGFPNPIRAETGADLYRMLSDGVGKTVMTTVQKFRTPLEKPLSQAENIIVLTDEAHRTQYGNFAFNLRKALPNAAFFAFTGTPLDKRDRNTYRVFSPEGETYLDRYTILQSEKDKATVPIKYTSRLPSLHMVGNSLDSLIEHLFPEKSKKELAQLKKQYATPEVLASAPKRIETIALDMVEHYNQFIKPNGLKTMVVAADRNAVVEYKNALDRLMGEERSAVVMTIDRSRDPDEWKEKYFLTDTEEENLKERFLDPKDSLSFLVVCDKLLAGFDAHVLQVMYLDHNLKEHTLLQAVARTNRVYPGKEYGIVVDYVGIGKELAEAVAMFGVEDLEGLFRTDDVERELENVKDTHQEMMKMLGEALRESASPKETVQQCVLVLKDADVRGKFDEVFRSMSKSIDFLMPDLRLEPYLKDFKRLGAIREAARNLYRDDRLRIENVSPKVEALIHAHIAAEGVEELLAPLTISAPDFKEKLEAKGSDRAKAIHLRYTLHETLTGRAAEDPVYYGSLQKRLEEIIELEEKERKDEAQLVLSYMDIKKEMDQKDSLMQSLGLKNKREFAVFNLLSSTEKKQEEKTELSRDIVGIIEERAVVEWTEREDVQKEMRREIKRLLRKKGFEEDNLPKLTREIMELAMQ